MGFDEENNDNRDDGTSNDGNDEKKSISFFGMELSTGVTYTIIIILALIFIRQAFIVFQALN